MNSLNESLYSEPSGFFSQRSYLSAALIFVFALGMFKYLFFYLRLLYNAIQTGARRRTSEGEIRESAIKEIRRLYHAIKNSGSKNFTGIIKEGLDIVSYNELIDLFIQKKMFQKVFDLLIKLKDPNFFLAINKETQKICIEGINNIIKSKESIDGTILKHLFKELIEANSIISKRLFIQIIESFILLKDIEYALEFYLNYKSKCNDILTEVLELLMSLGKQAKITPAFFSFVLDYIINNELVKDVVCLLVEVLVNNEDLNKLDQLLAVLKKYKDRVSLSSYGKMIVVYGSNRKRDRVLELGGLLEYWHLQPNEKTFGCLMENYLKCGLFDKVVETYRMIENKENYKYNLVIYTTLMRAYAKKRQFSKVLDLYQDIKSRGQYTLNRIAYNTLLDCCVECKQFHKIQEIFADMISKKTSVQSEDEKDLIEPDLITYSILIKGICKADCMDKAMEIYEEMKSKKMALDCILYNSLLDGFAKSKHHSKKYQTVLNDMKIRHIKYNDCTYSILIKLYSKHKDFNKVLDTYNTMKANNIKPTLIIYTCLLQACIKNHGINTALEIYEEIKEQSISLDAVAYNIIINGCIFSGKIIQGCKIICEAINNDILLAVDTYENCLWNIIQNGYINFSLKKHYAGIICEFIELKNIQISNNCYKKVKSLLNKVQVKTYYVRKS